MTSEVMTPWPEPDEGPTDYGEWETFIPHAPRGGAEFEKLHLAERRVLNALSGAALPADVAIEVADKLEEIATLVAAHQVDEHDRWDGWRPDLPGRGHPLLPPYTIDHETPHELSGRVSFPRFYLGGNGASHGGAQPLLFDDVLGRVVNHHQEGVARTAYLKVNYRRITPIDVELTFTVRVDKVDGRKRWCTGEMRTPDGEISCDVEALFVQLLPGQP
jgi:hypothetical protein